VIDLNKVIDLNSGPAEAIMGIVEDLKGRPKKSSARSSAVVI